MTKEYDEEMKRGIEQEVRAFVTRAVNNHSQLLAACKAQHEAIDRLFAMLIEAKPGFMPTQSGQPWDALVAGNEAIKRASGE